jgi:hypothetical protein
MMISHKTRFAPQKFKGNIKSIPLGTIIDLITFTCVLSVKSEEKNAALYFENGNLIGARLENEYNLQSAEEILTWETGIYHYQKWINDFEVDIKQLKDILYLIEIAYINAKVFIFKNNKVIDIRCSEGKIVSISPKVNRPYDFFQNILHDTTGKVRINLSSGQTGNLRLYFTDILTDMYPEKINIKTNDPKFVFQNYAPLPYKTLERKSGSQNIQKQSANKKGLNLDLIEKSFVNIKAIMGSALKAGVVLNTKNTEPIYNFRTERDQNLRFQNIAQDLNTILKDLNNTALNLYYLLDLKENKLAFVLTFETHHIGLVLEKNETKLGYLLNIIKPLMINDYVNALNNSSDKIEENIPVNFVNNPF